MPDATAARLRVLHATAGRMRVHLPGWAGGGWRGIESDLRKIPGVRGAAANPVTGNVLVKFDSPAADRGKVLECLGSFEKQPSAQAGPATEPARPDVMREGRGGRRRARISVRGLDRDPALSGRVVRQLHRRPGVKARANPLTGRVLVEYDERTVALEDLIADVVELELPDLPGEDNPAHPLDRGPLIQSAVRSAGAALGLGWVALQRLAGVRAAPQLVDRFARAAGMIGILQGFPFIRDGMRRLLGRDVADLLFNSAGIVTLSISGNLLGLLVIEAESLVLLREVMARQAAWRRYEERILAAPVSEPGQVIHLESGERVPRRAKVVEGTGTARGRDGLPMPLRAGAQISAGAKLNGGPFVVELQAGEPFIPRPRPAPPAPSIYQRYINSLGPFSLAYAVLTAVFTRSLSRAFQALLLVNPRPAVIGMETANLQAATRVLRGNVVVVGTRPGRPVRLPDALLLDGPRLLTDGLEMTGLTPLAEGIDRDQVLSSAAAVSGASGFPWGGALGRDGGEAAEDGRFDGAAAFARIRGVGYELSPLREEDAIPPADRLLRGGDHVLVLRRVGKRPEVLGLISLRPRLAPGARELVEACRRYGVEPCLLNAGDLAVGRALGRRAGMKVIDSGDAVALIRRRQRHGALVFFASDSAQAGEAFAASDLGIGVTAGWGVFPARADLLAPDLAGVCSIVEAGARRDAAVRDSVALSALSNVVGAAWGLRGAPGVQRASVAVHIASLAAIADGRVRLRGGERAGAGLARLLDPRPERWGRRPIEAVLRSLRATPHGLTETEAARRLRRAPPLRPSNALLPALRGQLGSPIALVLAGSALLSLTIGDALDAAIITATLLADVAAGVWQERQVGEAAEAMERLSSAAARVLRDGKVITIPRSAIVPGDVLALAPGDRVAADARLLSAANLEVDESMLTGESMPVVKSPDAQDPGDRVLLDGTDVLVGEGRAVAVAVGRDTRMGATAAALTLDETRESPLGARLGRVLRLALPLAVGGGTLAVLSGVLRGQGVLSQLPLGLSTALAVIPEGLPLLAGTGQAGVARRLAGRNALVRRLAAVEALGRVDVACADKTGTMTEGRLAIRLVARADGGREAMLPGALPADLREVLVTAALASPRPDAAGAAAHPTDLAVLRAAEEIGLDGELRAPRDAEAPFDPARGFHAARVHGRLCLKGAPESLAPRCVRLHTAQGPRPLDDAGRAALLGRAQMLAGRGLRVLLVAQGPEGEAPDDPHGLTALGFVGISDPLRPGVRAAVRRCSDAGVRTVMLTGDHPATARAIAQEAGLLDGENDFDGRIITGPELAELQDGELGRRLEQVTVIARATPLDKLRIIEGLRRSGHTVAMTGDGVNDAPALRLADVGVAMGRGGTDVARQAADLVLADDDFATLVEALVEGRGFWRNMRRGIGLLLGGNLGELGLIVGTSVLGAGSPLNTRQILVVNLITDVLPALAVVLQRPEHRDLAGLAREGVVALEQAIRRDVLRRGIATGLPAFGAYVLLRFRGQAVQANTAAFTSIVANQLAQTLDAGRVEGGMSRSVLGAVGGSAGLLGAALLLPPLREILGLTPMSLLGWAVAGVGSLGSILISRATAPLQGVSASPGAAGREPSPA